jgi:hypothetical protein
LGNPIYEASLSSSVTDPFEASHVPGPQAKTRPARQAGPDSGNQAC